MDQDELWNEVKLNIHWHSGADDPLSHQRALEKFNRMAEEPRPPLVRDDLNFEVERWPIARMYERLEPGQRDESKTRPPAFEELRVVFFRFRGSERIAAGVHRIGKWHREHSPTEEREVIIVTSTRGEP